MVKKRIRTLHTEADYEAAVAEIERYFDKEPEPGTRGAYHFNRLALALEHYESKHWPIEPDQSPAPPVAGPLWKD